MKYILIQLKPDLSYFDLHGPVRAVYHMSNAFGSGSSFSIKRNAGEANE